MATLHKKFSRKKHIVALNISDALVTERIEETSIRRLAAKIGVAEYRLRKLVNGELETDFLRSTINHKLWQISYTMEPVVQCTLMLRDKRLDDTVVYIESEVHKFTSAYKCCQFLGITRGTYYGRYKLQPVGKPCEKYVKDLFDRTWKLTFLKEIKNAGDWRFVQNENN